MPPSVPPAAGWSARLALRFEARAQRTVLAQKQQQGPLTVQRGFYPEGAPCHLYLLHPPGGVVGGDRLHIEARVAAGAHALLTAPGAAKFYRSAGALARQRQRFEVADGGVLEWLPPEAILFPGARLDLQTQVVLSGAARFIGWEILSLGRPAIGERFDQGRASLGLRLEREGRPLLSERLRLDMGLDLEGEPSTKGLDGPSGLRGQPISATLVATGATAGDLQVARALVPAVPGLALGLTLLDDLLVVRALAPKVEPVLLQFRALWQGLRPRLLGLEASAPRIWAT
ncbi:urease accessory protein UreD [Halochromatium salexigens]|uniref:Urease accessory protein UreD n=1 Tax=Halochromatium salexigens TaxID=49447 RepID=A0AAJ0UCZ4_HALSE|nr:urease accessory protein UreD [Halochromatium salexigens]MBK5929138.1 urease accessory protein [Halochromatium salexigens]